MSSTRCFLHICHLVFYLNFFFLPSNFEKIPWSNKFPKVPPSRNLKKIKNQDNICFLWDFGLWILNTWSFHSYTLHYLQAYPTNLDWIAKHWQEIGHSTKKTFSSPSIVTILQSGWSLWLRYFLQTIGIVRYMILWLKVKKNHFIFIFVIHANKYIIWGQKF
jgi:hypothetical protein